MRFAFAITIITAVAGTASAGAITRTHVTGDVYHYEFVVPVGSAPDAKLHIHRVVREIAPFIPRRSNDAILAMHGDFAGFMSNFMPENAPSMAVWLAQRGIDVWGLDRRFVPFGETDEVPNLATMGLAQELGDISVALTFTRATRLLTDASVAKISLVGFSRGGMLAYWYAAQESSRPVWQRHLKALVPIDVAVSFPPELEDLRLLQCDIAAQEQEIVDEGFFDSDNSLQIRIGNLAQSLPDEVNDFPVFFPGMSNREVFLLFLGQTYIFVGPSPWYHLAGTFLDGDGNPTALRFMTDAAAFSWLQNAPFHSPFAEAADTDRMNCGDAPLPLDLSLANIRVPLFLLGAAGGYGTAAIDSTTHVSSTDVTTHIVRRLPVGQELGDFGHGDLLLSADAPALAWQPLLVWLRGH